MTQNEASVIAVRYAMRAFDQMSTKEKVDLLNAASTLLPKENAALAEAMAFNIERLEVNQLKFQSLLNPPQ